MGPQGGKPPLSKAAKARAAPVQGQLSLLTSALPLLALLRIGMRARTYTPRERLAIPQKMLAHPGQPYHLHTRYQLT